MVVGLFLGIFLWEYFTLDLETPLKPSFFLNKIADNLVDIFKNVGRFIAWISSFYELIEWQKMKLALIQILDPTFQIIISWTNIFVGYFEFVKDYVYSLNLIFAGSITIGIIMVGIIVRFIPVPLRNMFWNILPIPNY